jgi:hypothetical protein
MTRKIIRVQNDDASSIIPIKYVYHSRPFNSTNIIFEIKDITFMDAGYYGGGTSEIAARSGQDGIFLLVKG